LLSPDDFVVSVIIESTATSSYDASLTALVVGGRIIWGQAQHFHDGSWVFLRRHWLLVQSV